MNERQVKIILKALEFNLGKVKSDYWGTITSTKEDFIFDFRVKLDPLNKKLKVKNGAGS